MQIKRFEAEDMTEALRMVKREFGDDAVILSAKEVRPGGFFSAFKKKCMEITAAADYPQASAEDSGDFSRQLVQQLDAESEKDRVSLSTRPQAFKAYADKGEPEAHRWSSPEPARDAMRRTDALPIRRRSRSQATSAAGGALENKPSQDREIGRLLARPFYRRLSGRQIIALVGTCGTGKSSALAKLAGHCRVVEKKKVGVISLDRFRIGGTDMLEKASRIMDLPFALVHDADQLRAALDDLSDVDVVLIDTPGMNGRDSSMQNDITGLLRVAGPDETHLVVNATVRREVVRVAVETFWSMKIDHLLFTHMDEVTACDAVADLIETHRLPSSFCSDGVDLFDHLRETTIQGLNRFQAPAQSTGQRVTPFPVDSTITKIEPSAGRDGLATIRFVANRNSELFHHADCKSVKRINIENITAFESMEQAMQEGFKPCRACCDIDMIRKVAPGVFGHQRMSAI